MSGWRVFGDWGTTRLRLWRMVDGVIVDRREGPGIGALTGAPAAAMRAALAPWLADHGPPVRITLCGMAGARNGLHEADYTECPAGVVDWRTTAARIRLEGIDVIIAAGFADGHDIMRGEETQVFGALRQDPAIAQGRQMLVVPGTHSKWVSTCDGRITGLRSFMTGELYALLLRSSLFAVGGDGSDTDDSAGFGTGLALARQSRGVLGDLFKARVAQLRAGRSADWARGLLSGLLIGGEVAEMRAAQMLPADVTIIGERVLAWRYAEALAAFDMTANMRQADACVLAGLELLDADN